MVIIIPDIIIPIRIAGNARLNFILKITAAKLAVQAPVVGNGTAVKRINAIAPYFFTLSLFRIVLLYKQAKNFSIYLEFLIKKSRTGSKNNRRGITGKAFPNTAIKKTLRGLIFIAIPTGIAPLNSNMGKQAVKNTAHSFDKKLLNH